jgi:hypothetical protein
MGGAAPDIVVIAGHSSLPCADCVDLSAVPAIRGSKSIFGFLMDARVKPAHDELEIGNTP